jgi:hypothetical protein
MCLHLVISIVPHNRRLSRSLTVSRSIADTTAAIVSIDTTPVLAAVRHASASM